MPSARRRDRVRAAAALREREFARAVRVLRRARPSPAEPETYPSLPLASAALEARGGLAAGLAIGLAVSAVAGVGLVVAYLLFRRRDDAPAAPPVVLAGPWGPSSVQALDRRDEPSLRYDTRVRTVPLPTLTDPRDPVRLATGPAAGVTSVTVRALGPLGSFAVVAFHPNEFQAARAGGVPIGDTLVVQAGDRQRFALRPGQAVLAKGSDPGVLASVVHDG